MVRMFLSGIKIDEKNEGQVIMLREKSGPRCLPIVIGFSEVVAIKRNLSGIRSARPMTHDLLADSITALGARVEKIVIDKIEANTFFAKIIVRLKKEGCHAREVSLDARPSDSIALALRVDAPIFVEEKVFSALKECEKNY